MSDKEPVVTTAAVPMADATEVAMRDQEKQGGKCCTFSFVLFWFSCCRYSLPVCLSSICLAFGSCHLATCVPWCCLRISSHILFISVRDNSVLINFLCFLPLIYPFDIRYNIYHKRWLLVRLSSCCCGDFNYVHDLLFNPLHPLVYGCHYRNYFWCSDTG